MCFAHFYDLRLSQRTQHISHRTPNMVRLSNDSFLNELTRLFERRKSVGGVFITFKRYTPALIKGDKGGMKEGGKKKHHHHKDEEAEHYCLVRATDGKKGKSGLKISTQVSSKDVVRFQMQYHNILKVHFDSLKKRTKVKVKGMKKAKAKE